MWEVLLSPSSLNQLWALHLPQLRVPQHIFPGGSLWASKERTPVSLQGCLASSRTSRDSESKFHCNPSMRERIVWLVFLRSNSTWKHTSSGIWGSFALIHGESQTVEHVPAHGWRSLRKQNGCIKGYSSELDTRTIQVLHLDPDLSRQISSF